METLVFDGDSSRGRFAIGTKSGGAWVRFCNLYGPLLMCVGAGARRGASGIDYVFSIVECSVVLQ